MEIYEIIRLILGGEGERLMLYEPANALRTIGMHPKYKGYAYTRHCLQLTLLHADCVYRLTTQLYPAIAEHFTVTPTSVERSIRFAIRRTWENGNKEELKRLFCVYDVKWAPTNSEFIAVLTEAIANNRISTSVQMTMFL